MVPMDYTLCKIGNVKQAFRTAASTRQNICKLPRCEEINNEPDIETDISGQHLGGGHFGGRLPSGTPCSFYSYTRPGSDATDFC